MNSPVLRKHKHGNCNSAILLLVTSTSCDSVKGARAQEIGLKSTYLKI